MSTYLSLRYHLIFATKERKPYISPEWRSRLHRYLGGIVSSLGGNAHVIGGTADHVHLLVELRATHALSDFMRDFKARFLAMGPLGCTFEDLLLAGGLCGDHG
jgi:REP element-mobilizing transposase RayT